MVRLWDLRAQSGPISEFPGPQQDTDAFLPWCRGPEVPAFIAPVDEITERGVLRRDPRTSCRGLTQNPAPSGGAFADFANKTLLSHRDLTLRLEFAGG
jgi:hypothetical protein